MSHKVSVRCVSEISVPNPGRSIGLRLKTRDLRGNEKYLSVNGETKAELYKVLSQFGVSEGGETDLFSTHCCECAEIVYSEKNS